MAINLPIPGIHPWAGALNAALSHLDEQTVVDGEIVGDDLILVRNDGTEINAGNVRGPAGTVTTHTHTATAITDFSTAVPAAVPAASPTVQGKIELATNAEVATGTDTSRAVTPSSLRATLGDPETDLAALFQAGLV